jgi:hypothetical protein
MTPRKPNPSIALAVATEECYVLLAFRRRRRLPGAARAPSWGSSVDKSWRTRAAGPRPARHSGVLGRRSGWRSPPASSRPVDAGHVDAVDEVRKLTDAAARTSSSPRRRPARPR